ncbi:hypothetical protein [Jatrophihabitans lederbergiae]|uniref:Uncharacterized protein n=1 Tax=Jatrophihabitans lederbergiae TaxID=3075547 RepID=A0ABU2JDT6_9ACTN|nr:hypothetical protein [Jatrophihabitans sp. DSM 44399]MDT0263144.1 hypothetical protein [Jatrophihabitans sp. DSM 44399]
MQATAREHGYSVVRWITAEDNHQAQLLYDQAQLLYDIVAAPHPLGHLRRQPMIAPVIRRRTSRQNRHRLRWHAELLSCSTVE